MSTVRIYAVSNKSLGSPVRGQPISFAGLALDSSNGEASPQIPASQIGTTFPSDAATNAAYQAAGAPFTVPLAGVDVDTSLLAAWAQVLQVFGHALVTMPAGTAYNPTTATWITPAAGPIAYTGPS